MPFLQVLTVSRSSSNSSYHTLQAARRIAVFEEDDDFCTLFFWGGAVHAKQSTCSHKNQELSKQRAVREPSEQVGSGLSLT